MPFEYDRAVARLPRWILALGILGVVFSGFFGGLPVAGGFLSGTLAAYFNFRLIERAVNRVSRLASEEPARALRARGAGLFIQFAFIVLGVFVILNYSGFNMTAALCGFLVCPGAVVLEILYELLTYGHS